MMSVIKAMITEQYRQSGYLQWIVNHWKLAIVGAVVLALVMSLSLGALVVVIMRSSGAVDVAVQQIENSDEAVALIGEPVSVGWLIDGSVSGGPAGRASLLIPVSGPNGSATAQLEAAKADGQWTVLELILVTGDGDVLHVVERGNKQGTKRPANGTGPIHR